MNLAEASGRLSVELAFSLPFFQWLIMFPLIPQADASPTYPVGWTSVSANLSKQKKRAALSSHPP
jgi:hypothetical protein